MTQNKAVESARAKEVVRLLKKRYAASKCSLNYSNPHELLVATILSALSVLPIIKPPPYKFITGSEEV